MRLKFDSHVYTKYLITKFIKNPIPQISEKVKLICNKFEQLAIYRNFAEQNENACEHTNFVRLTNCKLSNSNKSQKQLQTNLILHSKSTPVKK